MNEPSTTVLEDSLTPGIAAGLLCLITLFGCFLRQHNLAGSGLWIDEILSVRYSSGDLSSVVANRTGNPPSYYVLLHGWTSLFGTGEASLRWLSVLFGSLAVFLTGVLGFDLYDRKTGLLAALFLSIMVFPIHYSREARVYSVFLVLTIASFWFLLRALRDGKRSHWIGYFLFTAASCYAHNYWIFNVLAQNVYVLLIHPSAKGFRLRWLGLQLAIVLCYLPWVGVLHRQATTVAHTGFWTPRPTWDDLPKTFRSHMGFLINPYLPWVHFLLCLCGAILPWKKRPGDDLQDSSVERRKVWLLLLWALFPVAVPFLLSFAVTPFFYIRYTLAATVPLYLLLARGVWAVPSNAGKATALLFVLVVSMFSVQRYYNFVEGNKQPFMGSYFLFPIERWREFVPAFLKELEPDDSILISPPYYARAFRYYSPRSIPMDVLINLSTEDRKATLQATMRQAMEGRNRVWIIDCSPSPEKEQLVDQYFARQFRKNEIPDLIEPALGTVVYRYDRRKLEHR